MMRKAKIPRVTIAGLGGDSGKTIVSTGILALLKKRKLSTAVFKKGPDYIDPLWLKYASGNTVRNLDRRLMSDETILSSFKRNAAGKDFTLIEGNRGLYDGVDAGGTYSTAELAKLLDSPVILTASFKKITATAAAIILGLQQFDKDVNIAGIILNQYGNDRQRKVITEAIEKTTGIPVIGAIPRLKNKTDILPSRHLGLITPDEYESANKAVDELAAVIEKYIDIEKVISIAESAPEMEIDDAINIREISEIPERKVRIAYFFDKAFSFYYDENLEALQKRGAELVKLSAIDDKDLKGVHALYIGGGFPETNIDALTSNSDMMKAVKTAADNNMPIYAECGGMMYLARSLELGGEMTSLANVLPVELTMSKKPQGHGYMNITIDKENPFFEKGVRIKGHEFHYSKVSSHPTDLPTCMAVERGTGTFDGRDGMIYKNCLGAYIHIHASATPEWAEGLVKKAIEFKNQTLD
ncbi:MAG: hydrogenobyrinic acid a,c-diamide synthase (glutamine-hydrolyzing) [Candidatus Kapabacteria bacterium]|nr:hydrogenobyrinic acid a,c-diamide synthase (glutamine-hydrolyzing) [Candidatus Kapabacteria bacterium]